MSKAKELISKIENSKTESKNPTANKMALKFAGMVSTIDKSMAKIGKIVGTDKAGTLGKQIVTQMQKASDELDKAVDMIDTKL